jgi:hypothetical protein
MEIKKFKNHKENLMMIGNNVYSYSTKVAVVKNGKLHKLNWNVNGRTSSPTTSRHINYVAKELGLVIT